MILNSAHGETRLKCEFISTLTEYDGKKKIIKGDGVIDIIEDTGGVDIKVISDFHGLGSLDFSSSGRRYPRMINESDNTRWKLSLRRSITAGRENYFESSNVLVDRISGFTQGEFSLWRPSVGTNGITFTGNCDKLDGKKKF